MRVFPTATQQNGRMIGCRRGIMVTSARGVVLRTGNNDMKNGGEAAAI
jgi:hypothetical protein